MDIVNEQIKAVSKLPMVKRLEWIIPAAILLFLGAKVYQLVLQTKLNNQQRDINNFTLQDFMAKYPDSSITKEIQTENKYLKKIKY